MAAGRPPLDRMASSSGPPPASGLKPSAPAFVSVPLDNGASENGAPPVQGGGGGWEVQPAVAYPPPVKPPPDGVAHVPYAGIGYGGGGNGQAQPALGVPMQQQQQQQQQQYYPGYYPTQQQQPPMLPPVPPPPPQIGAINSNPPPPKNDACCTVGAVIGFMLSWIPLIGFITACVHIPARHNKTRFALGLASLFVATAVFAFTLWALSTEQGRRWYEDAKGRYS